MTPGRLRLIAFAAIVLEAGLVALAWSQPWYGMRLSGTTLEVGGDVAGGALLPLGLASLALVAALALAGPVFRVILGVLDALLGVCVVVVANWSLSDPVAASFPFLVDALGLSGQEAIRDAVTGSTSTAWPVVGLVGGILMVLTGLAIAATARAWPTTASRYSRSRLHSTDGTAIDDWDALSEGDDPTASPR